MVITSVAAVEMRRLKFSAVAYLCQALLMVESARRVWRGQHGALLVGRHRARYQGHSYTVVPLPVHPGNG